MATAEWCQSSYYRAFGQFVLPRGVNVNSDDAQWRAHAHTQREPKISASEADYEIRNSDEGRVYLLDRVECRYKLSHVLLQGFIEA